MVLVRGERLDLRAPQDRRGLPGWTKTSCFSDRLFLSWTGWRSLASGPPIFPQLDPGPRKIDGSMPPRRSWTPSSRQLPSGGRAQSSGEDCPPTATIVALHGSVAFDSSGGLVRDKLPPLASTLSGMAATRPSRVWLAGGRWRAVSSTGDLDSWLLRVLSRVIQAAAPGSRDCEGGCTGWPEKPARLDARADREPRRPRLPFSLHAPLPLPAGRRSLFLSPGFPSGVDAVTPGVGRAPRRRSRSGRKGWSKTEPSGASRSVRSLWNIRRRVWIALHRRSGSFVHGA